VFEGQMCFYRSRTDRLQKFRMLERYSGKSYTYVGGKRSYARCGFI